VTGIYTPRTKIVCTLGPSTASDDTIRGLIEAGMNVARVNFSHGTHQQHAATIAMVRRLAQEAGKPIAILGDLQGPRIRIGDLVEPITLRVGEDVVLVHEGHEKKGEIPVTYDQLANDVRVGDRILIDDGLIELVALEVGNARVKARVINDGELKSHKGLNLPGVQVSAPSITEKDEADIRFAVGQEVDYLALSFVRR
jgi:pyruvate kinase